MEKADKELKFASPEKPLAEVSAVVLPEEQEPIEDQLDGTTEIEQGKKAKKPRSPFQESLQRFRRDIRAMVSLGVLVFMIVLALIGPTIYKHIGGIYESDLNGPIGPAIYHDYTHQELSHHDEGPSAQYWLGTDSLG